MDNKAASQYLQTHIRDTPIGILELQQEMWQKNSAEERLKLTCEHIDSCRMVFESSIQNRNPSWSKEEVQLEVFRKSYESFFSKSEMENIIESIKINRTTTGSKF